MRHTPAAGCHLAADATWLETKQPTMIVEGIVTTLNEDQSVNVAPMGPQIGADWTHFCLRPYQTSTTYRNLCRHGEGVLHVTDNVELLARAAIGRLDPQPPMQPAPCIRGMILVDTCRWYAFRVCHLADDEPRSTILCRVVQWGRVRDFVGFNRAKHAVVEAAILATRVHILPSDQIRQPWEQWATLVAKTTLGCA